MYDTSSYIAIFSFFPRVDLHIASSDADTPGRVLLEILRQKQDELTDEEYKAYLELLLFKCLLHGCQVHDSAKQQTSETINANTNTSTGVASTSNASDDLASSIRYHRLLLASVRKAAGNIMGNIRLSEGDKQQYASQLEEQAVRIQEYINSLENSQNAEIEENAVDDGGVDGGHVGMQRNTQGDNQDISPEFEGDLESSSSRQSSTVGVIWNHPIVVKLRAFVRLILKMVCYTSKKVISTFTSNPRPILMIATFILLLRRLLRWRELNKMPLIGPLSVHIKAWAFQLQNLAQVALSFGGSGRT
jgi:hypothetical protein